MAFARAFLALSALLAGAAAAAAQTLPISGPHGNMQGCVYLGGGFPAVEEMFVLNPDRLQAYAGGCEFVQVLPSADGAAVVTGLCQSEGSYYVRTLVVSPPDPENDSLLVFFDNGELWHEVRPCE